MRSVLNCQRIARDAKEEEYGKSLSEVSRSHSRQRYEKTTAEGPNVEQPNTVTPSVFSNPVCRKMGDEMDSDYWDRQDYFISF